MWQRLLHRKTVTALPPRNLSPGVQIDVPELPVFLYKEVAGKDIAVVFHHHVAVTRFVHGTRPRLLSGYRFGHVVEAADPHLAPVRPPEIEQLHHKAAILLRRNRER